MTSAEGNQFGGVIPVPPLLRDATSSAATGIEAQDKQDSQPSKTSAAATHISQFPRSQIHHYHGSHLAPQDAYFASSIRQTYTSQAEVEIARRPKATRKASSSTTGTRVTSNPLNGPSVYDSVDDSRGRSRSRRRKKKKFNKLLWQKQPYRDNYTDQATFLESLQRNPRLQPYQFWTLFSDSAVIVQQVCAVVIFVACFSLVFQERISCSFVGGSCSIGTFLGWVVWSGWTRSDRERDRDDAVVTSAGNSSRHQQQQQQKQDVRLQEHPGPLVSPAGVSGQTSSGVADKLAPPPTVSTTAASFSPSSASPTSSPADFPRHDSPHSSLAEPPQISRSVNRRPSPDSSFHVPRRWPRSRRRDLTDDMFATLKTAFLIPFFVAAVSPILKSLTRSFASDSIWAMSCLLLLINVFFFDYSIGIHPPPVIQGASVAGAVSGNMVTSTVAGMPRSGPAAFALNSATMASTVLASRLPQTTQVFSLTIFSMEMFALFPIFRRYARHYSLPTHVALTSLLVVVAGATTGSAFGGPEDTVRNAVRGIIVGVLGSILAMGGCSYWLISLQKYKNAIIGPWDPARPVIGPGALARMHFQQD